MEFGNHKRLRTCKEANGLGCVNNGVRESARAYKSLGNSDPFAVANLLERLSEGKYGSVTEEYESVYAQVSSFVSALRRSFGKYLAHAESRDVGLGSLPADGQEHAKPPKQQSVAAENEASNAPVIVIDSDEDDARHRQDENAVDPGHEPLAIQVWQPDHREGAHDQQGISVDVYRHDHVDNSELAWQPSILVQKVNLTTSAGNVSLADLVDNDEATPLLSPFSVGKSKGKGRRRAKAGENPVKRKSAEVNNNESKTGNVGSDKAVLGEKYNAIEGCDFVGDLQPPSPDIESPSQSDPEASSNDGLGDLWQDMSLAMEFSKTAVSDQPESSSEDECDHLFVLKDDLGVVCRVCGIIQKSIEKIVDYQLAKSSRTTRIYSNESRSQKDLDGILPSFSGLKSVHHDIHVADIAIHPRHEKQMKSHQLEGFHFLVKNLVADNPGGCILAHAPGSGKTFMLISFIQSFLAKYHLARPLVVLPKGILPTWKKEFEKWQVEEIPIYDFYSQKADNRSQQLDVLKNWEANRSILFLGYKQFANIICDGATSKVAAACQEHLLKVPSLLIIDEGHTPRNDNTDVLNALSRVQTPRKVVLSGTLFQNHVKEVFNILNLVRPKFLKMELSRSIVTRIMSRVHISGAKRVRPDMYASFYELVEETLQCDSDLKRKITIIRDLREMTQHVLHYYKGDFLDELPGLIDFTVMLKLSAKQKQTVQKIGKMDKFRRSAICRAIYMHPYLNEISENVTGDRSCDLIVEKIDNIIDNLDVKDGVKTKFFLSVLSLSVSVGEKLLVFSQYLLPLKFLERMVARLKGWRSGKEMFMISGDSSPDEREWAMEQFNSSLDARVFFGSIKACGEGISLIGASRVLILDVHLNPSVSRQAIGRAFRPGQTKKVYVYRLVAADSPEEEDHSISFRKELTSKMWFEWNEYSKQDFEMETANIEDSEDIFFESTFLAEDVKCLYRR